MKSIHEALKLTDVNEINQEIQERRDLIKVMVGRLYPSILQDEIFALRTLKEKLTYGPIPSAA